MTVDVMRLRTQTVVTTEIYIDFQSNGVKVNTEPDHQPISLTVDEFVNLIKKGVIIYQDSILDTVIILITPGARETLTPLINLMERTPTGDVISHEPETEATD